MRMLIKITDHNQARTDHFQESTLVHKFSTFFTSNRILFSNMIFSTLYPVGRFFFLTNIINNKRKLSHNTINYSSPSGKSI